MLIQPTAALGSLRVLSCVVAVHRDSRREGPDRLQMLTCQGCPWEGGLSAAVRCPGHLSFLGICPSWEAVLPLGEVKSVAQRTEALY